MNTSKTDYILISLCFLLGLASISLYAPLLYANFVEEGLFRYIFVDYQVWWAAANVYQKHGAIAVYDIEYIKQYQQIFDRYYFVVSRPQEMFVLPFAYPPFLLPFLSLIPTADIWASFCTIQASIILCSFSSVALSMILVKYSLPQGSVKLIKLLPTAIILFFSFSFLYGIVVSNPSCLLIIPASFLLFSRQFPLLAGMSAFGLWMKPNIAGILCILFLSLGPRRIGYGLGAGGLILFMASSLSQEGLNQWVAWWQLVSNYSEYWGGWQLFQPTLRMLTTRVSLATNFQHFTILYLIAVGFLFFRLFQDRKNDEQSEQEFLFWLLKLSLFTLLVNVHCHIHTWLFVAPFLLALSAYSSIIILRISISIFTFPLLLHLSLIYFGFDLGIAHALSSLWLVAAGLLVIFMRPNWNG